MLERFYPDLYLDSAYQIDFGEYHKKGYRGIIFDIDNTLVPHGAPADARSIELIGRLKEMGFGVVFLSNNKEPRVKMFNDAVHAEYIYNAGKPGRENTLFVGDQLFTDVWGARNTGIFSILVRPMDKKEEIQIVLKRYLEKIVLAFYRRKCAADKTRQNGG